MAVEWEYRKLSDLTPTVAKPIEGLVGELKTLAVVAHDTSEVINSLIPSVTVLADPLIAATDELLSTIQSLINDVVNTGVYFLFIPPLSGTPGNFGQQITAALRNRRDSRSPQFTLPSTMAMVGGLVYAPDFDQITAYYDSLRRRLVSKAEVQRALGVVKLEEALGLTESYYANLMAGTARPLKNTPWVSMKAADMVPGLEPLARRVNGMLMGIRDAASIPMTLAFSRYAQNRVKALTSVIDEISTLVSALTSLLDIVPLQLFTVAPAALGTAELSSMVTKGFDASNNPNLASMGSPVYMTGFALVLGAAGSTNMVQAQYDALTALLGI